LDKGVFKYKEVDCQVFTAKTITSDGFICAYIGRFEPMLHWYKRPMQWPSDVTLVMVDITLRGSALKRPPGNVTLLDILPTQPWGDVVLSRVNPTQRPPDSRPAGQSGLTPAITNGMTYSKSCCTNATLALVDTKPGLLNAILVFVDAILAIVNAILVRAPNAIPFSAIPM
jgi:hypothetical protein